MTLDACHQESTCSGEDSPLHKVYPSVQAEYTGVLLQLWSAEGTKHLPHHSGARGAPNVEHSIAALATACTSVGIPNTSGAHASALSMGRVPKEGPRAIACMVGIGVSREARATVREGDQKNIQSFIWLGVFGGVQV